MSKRLSSQLRDFISQKIKDGKINHVLKKPIKDCIRDIDHGIATKNQRKLVQAIKKMCDLFIDN